MRLAAIDIGSNAARLLISEAGTDMQGKPEFNKLSLVRVPLRLGFDVFETKAISPAREEMIIKTMRAYKDLMEVYEVTCYKACATSAMRDARNAAEIIDKVKKEIGISIEVISGDEEATVFYHTTITDLFDKDHTYLYIDVGGGSTELTLFNETQVVAKQSFNIGTIRLLKDLVEESLWNKMKDYIKEITKGQKKVIAIGCGGNINKVFSLSKKKDGKPLSLDLLKDYHHELGNFSVHDRMKLYNLREDRADVIVPALLIYTNVMRWADADEILVPKIGLVDGLIQQLYYERNQ